MKRISLSLASLALLCGCATSPMKSTPFYDGKAGCYTGRAEDRVNLWPVTYWREPALSVAWPVYSQADDHWAIRPFYSQYRQGGAGYDDFNVLWPVCQFDTKHDVSWIFPFAWSGNGTFSVIPVFWWTKNWFVLGPFATERKKNMGTLFPLIYWDNEMGNEHLWTLAGLWGYWHDYKKPINHWFLPFYLKNSTGFFSIPWSQIDHETQCTDYYLCGLGGYERTPAAYRSSWLFPFYYHDQEGFYTPLCGSTDESGWLFPFYYRNKTGFHTLLCSSTDTGWCVLLGLAGGRTNASGNRHESWAFPFYHRDEGRSFTSLAYGWNGGQSDKTNTWWAAGLAGTRSGAVEGSWVFPFYSTRDDVRFDEIAEKMDAEQLTDVLTEKELEKGFVASKRKTFLLLSDYDESVVGRPYSSPSKSYSMTRSKKAGTCLLWGQWSDHRIDFDLAGGEKRKDLETEMTGSLLFLYYSRCTQNRMTQKSTASYRILWKLWDWERKDDDVTLDVFPFFTYDSKASGYSKVSFLWRLFRNEYDPKTDKRSVDFLFIPVWR